MNYEILQMEIIPLQAVRVNVVSAANGGNIVPGNLP